MSDARRRLDRIVTAIRRNPVVPLTTWRQLRSLADQLDADGEAERVLASLSVELHDSVRWWEDRLLDAADQVCDTHRGAKLAELVRAVGRNPDFRRLNRQIRWHRAVYLKQDLPDVHVRAHVRAGRTVREHSRLVGFGHLLAMDMAGRSDVVVQVIHALVARSSAAPAGRGTSA